MDEEEEKEEGEEEVEEDDHLADLPLFSRFLSTGSVSFWSSGFHTIRTLSSPGAR